MSNCDSCTGKSSCSTKDTCGKTFIKYGNIKNIIGVISGKGGVGKSTVTGILAIELQTAGYKVGILDADITGPSMPRFFGVHEKKAEILQENEAVTFIPIETSIGIKVISLNSLTEVEEQPVIWRGPVINGVLNQMYQDTKWGELDYLLIDMPPGTGDVALTVMQSFPLTGMVMVATPQDMVTMIVKKAVIMAEKLKIRLLGVVENMSYVQCEGCDKKIKLFSKKSSQEQAESLGLPLLAEFPMDLELVEKIEEGKIEKYIQGHTQYNGFFRKFMEQVKNNLNV